MVSSAIKTNAYELDWLRYVFQETALASMSMSPDLSGEVKLCLFKSDPRATAATMPTIGGVGSLEPTTGEYASYARLVVNADSTEWTCATDGGGVSTATKATNDAVFAAAGGGSTGCLCTWLGVAMERADAAGDVLLYAWQLVNPITVSAGIAPRVGVGDLVHEQQ